MSESTFQGLVRTMINIDSLSIKAFLAENLEYFIGARAQKIQQPNRRELIFHLRNQGESRKFYININPSFYHICFMSKENEIKRNIEIPKAPAMFCMLLRKYLEGARITAVEQPDYERILEIYFEYYDALNEKIQLCLAIELMGKHSNVILYNFDTNVIIGCAHNVGSEKSKERELAGLLPYIYPPKQKKQDVLKISFEKFVSIVGDFGVLWQEELAESFYYLTKPLVRTVIEELKISDKPSSDELLLLHNEFKRLVGLKYLSPYIKEDFSEFSLYPVKEAGKFNSVNEMLDEYFSYHQQQKLIKNLRSKVLIIANNQIKKLSNLKEKQMLQLEKQDKTYSYKEKGDILMSNLHLIKPNLNKIFLNDFQENPIEIELDELITPIENANRYYKLYKKSKASSEYNQKLLEETKNQLDYYLEQKFYAEIADSISDLEEIYDEIKEDSKNNNNIPQKKSEIKLKVFDIDGFRVYLGKNSVQNDYLLSKIASPEDIWFHPFGFAGAHVVLKKNNSKEIVPDKVLFEAAKITKEYSAGKNASKVPIIYTLRKYVKKGTNKKLAFVTYKNETEILVG